MTSSNRQALFEPRKNNTIDLTVSSDEEDSPVEPTKPSRRRPPIVNSDSDSDDSDVNIISSQRARLAVQASDSEDQEEELRAIPKVNKPHLVTRGNSEEDSGEDIESSGSEEEEEDELEEDESSDHSIVVPDDKVEPRPNPRPASMADALAAMSFKKKASSAPVAQEEAIELDSDQENALRGYGFLPISKPKPTTTDPRSFHTSLTSKSNPTFLKPKLTAPLAHRTSNQLPASSSSSSTNFSSTSAAFNLKAQPISVKSRLGAQIQQENVRKGIPIDVPKNPPSTSFRREEKPKASKGELSLLYLDRYPF